MAERHRSQDGSRDSKGVLGARGAVSGQGRKGGALQREIASADEMKRATERPAGKAQVTKSKERGKGERA